MGKVEKVVVLGVLFSVLVILAVSMYSSPDDEVQVDPDPAARRSQGSAATRLDRPQGPLQASRGEESGALPLPSSRGAEVQPSSPGSGAPVADRSVADASIENSRWQRRQPAPAAASTGVETLAVAERPQRPQARGAEALVGSGSGGLLSSSVRSRSRADAAAQQPAAPERRSAPDPAWDLITLEGLEPTLDPRFQVYTCSGDETYVSLAESLYGTVKKAALLRRDNEGVDTLSAGQELLVAVVDDRPGGGDTYEVLEGDNLWGIAKKVYDAGHRWQEIYEANKETLGTPDNIRPGVVLVIP